MTSGPGQGLLVNERIEPDKWYVTVNCSYCGEAIAITKAPPPRDEPHPLFRKETATCPLCQHVDTYQPALMCRRLGQSLKTS